MYKLCNIDFKYIHMDTFPRVSIYPHKYIYICIYSLYIYIYISKKLKVGHGGGDHIYILYDYRSSIPKMTIVEMTFM